MYETIQEGKAIIRIKKADKISKEMEVFYNPVMKLNRDISILLLNSIDNNNMQIALPLTGSGIRGLRFLKELKKNKIKSISFNDYDKKAVESIKNSFSLNRIKNKKIVVYNEDANLFLLNSSGFDYIDVDPFGTSNYYLDSAVKRISRNGILAVTNTDTAALTGTYPKACVRKYWSTAKKDYMMHETGLRILIRKVQLVGMQYEKALFPVFSYFKDHYFRIFFQCVKGKKQCEGIGVEQGMFDDAGPLWTGSLWDGKLVNKMYSTLKNYNGEINNTKDSILIKNEKTINNTITNDNKSINKNNEINNNELLKFLKIIKDESKINSVGFYDIHQIAKKKKLKIIMKKNEIIKKIKKKGFKAADTHFSGIGIRSDIDYDKLLTLLKE
jgi:tRNA (guanine26-N2/guanine27-N2)-dimethyltransferase